ncbi:MAG TPA: rhodanese-like domain-containing protein [Kofleriaceae bacterium]|nr:rhodanese-like domain-containing protein [Kofleriaceae bacterium]
MTIDPTQAREKVRTGEALLVCAYAHDEVARSLLLDGAMTLTELRHILSDVDKSHEIVFYDAGGDDDIARSRTEQMRAQGYDRARFIEGGAAAWKKAGLPLAVETAPESSPGAPF